MQFKHLVGLACLTVLTACSSVDSTDEAVPASSLGGRCDASAVQNMLGKSVTPELVKKMRTASGAKTSRVLGPSDPMTLDYNPTRLNIDTDEADVIDRITCG